MPAMTIDQIVDRVRAVCAGAPFFFEEAVTWESFDRQPTTNLDAVFRIPPPSSQSVLGGFGFTEDRTDTVQIWLARKHQQDYAGVRTALLADMHQLTAAIVRDAHEQSGDYAVLDEGRGYAIEGDDPSREYMALRLTLPVNYESQL